MNRRMIIDFCNKNIFPQVTGKAIFYMDCKEVVKTVIDWRKANGYPKEMIARVDDGFLHINNIPVIRIAPKEPHCAFSEEAYYWEDRILARQETD
ncbi:MAG: hypothetical protein K6F00_11175 [Lachnospiraceae bacterium]|nr:hypothetical protein [Lachnospiraceae bacterium]